MLEGVRKPSRRDPGALWSHSTSPGSTVPDRVAMTSPSSGVKPMVVSTDRPPSTAASDAPAPRWQVTRRSSTSGLQATRRRDAAYVQRRPWNPYRRRLQRLRHSRGRAYVAAACGKWAWNAVSKHATAGTFGSARPTAWRAASDFGWWSGARSIRSRSRWRTCSSTTTGSLNSAPP